MAKSAKSSHKDAAKTTVGIFPFDLFGGGGAARGAELLADALRELIDDNRRERQPTRAQVYRDRLHLHEFCFEKLADYQDWRNQARQFLRGALSRHDFLLWLGGNHLGALPVYEELAAGPADTLIVQFDAHLDIYNLSDCTTELSHGNFLLHCDGRLPPLINVGHRELLLTDKYIGKYYQQHFPASQLAVQPDQVLQQLRALGKNAARVFIDLDCDVLDAAYFPALSHTQPFGLSPHLLLRLMDAVWSEKVIGLAISEFDPARDRDDRSLALLMWLIEFALLRRYEMSR